MGKERSGTALDVIFAKFSFLSLPLAGRGYIAKLLRFGVGGVVSIHLTLGRPWCLHRHHHLWGDTRPISTLPTGVALSVCVPQCPGGWLRPCPLVPHRVVALSMSLGAPQGCCSVCVPQCLAGLSPSCPSSFCVEIKGGQVMGGLRGAEESLVGSLHPSLRGRWHRADLPAGHPSCPALGGVPLQQPPLLQIPN